MREHSTVQVYSDIELSEFRNLIIKKKEIAEEDFRSLVEASSNKSWNGTDDTAPSFKGFEDAQNALCKEENRFLAQRQEVFIKSLNEALFRIENKTYGVCRVTGKKIQKERLLSVPHTTTSIVAKKMKK